jgi:hypothetical protein
MGAVEAAVRATVARQLALSAATGEVLDAMVEARIRTVMLKGAAIATRLYEHPFTRPAGDLDLLVAPDEAPAAARVLERLGFRDPLLGARAHERTAYGVAFYRGGALPACVDLHRTLYWCNHDPDRLWREFSRATVIIDIDGRSVEVLEDHAQALVIAAHAVQHVKATQPRQDLRRALDTYEQDTWVKAEAMARRLGAESVLAAGLRLSEAGARVADELALEEKIASLEVRLRLSGPPPVGLGLMHLAQARSMRQRGLLVLGELVPTPTGMRAWLGFAQRGRVALALAYLYRPVWLSYKLPGAVRAWRRARRSG